MKRSKSSPISRASKRTDISKPILNREIQDRIGANLRAMHDDILKEGVPDRFLELLAKLDQPRKSRTGR
jgi:hypothetical protein